MINLLPYEQKSEIRAGRLNVTLGNYVVLSLIALALVAGIVIFAYISLMVTRANAQTRVDENSKKVLGYSKTSTDAANFRTNLSVAKQILDKQVAYSALLLNIAKYVPSGVVLDGITADQKSIGKPTNITAHATTSDAVLALKTQLESQPTLFTDVQLSTVTFEQLPVDPQHPISIEMSFIIAPGALE